MQDRGVASPPSRLDRPERKNPLTFDSYAELRDWFRDLHYADDVRAVVFAPNGGNFSSGGDVHDIIGPLTKMNMKELLAFTRMTGDLVKAMINCGKPIIAAVDGVCAGAGAIIAMASDLRIATPEAKTAFLFNRVGLAGCDMGACAILPRIIGQGRAAELLYLGRSMSAEEGAAWGYFNKVVPAGELLDTAQGLARRIADGPSWANMMTKTMLAQEWSMSRSNRPSRPRRRRRRSACRGRISTAPIMRSSPRKNRCSRAIDGRPELSQLALLRRPPPRAGDGGRAFRQRPEQRSWRCGCGLPCPCCRLGEAGIAAHSGAEDGLMDVRTLCLIRETLARHDGLADFAFAMQGLGTGAISLFGSPEQKAEWLPRTRAGKAISAFALTEPGSGSDVAANTMSATLDGNHYVLNGQKTWISNGGIADVYTVFARTGEAPGAKGMSAFMVPADTPGLTVAERLETIAPHPLATLDFADVRVPATAMIGAPGQGFKIAMSVLDVFRSTVAAAALWVCPPRA